MEFISAPPHNPAETAAAHGPAPIDMATAHEVMSNPEAAGRGNRLLQVGAKIGEMATDLYQRTVVGVGNVMSGTRPEAAAPAPPTPDASATGSRWETFSRRVALGGNIIKWGTFAAGVGAVAVKAVAARHGMEAGGAGGHHFQTIAEVAATHRSEEHHAELLVGGLIAGTVVTPAAVVGVRKAMRNARHNRAEALRLTRDQPRVGGAPQPSAQDVIRNRAAKANEDKIRRLTTSRSGVPVHTTAGYVEPAGIHKDKFAKYNPMERIAPASSMRPGAPRHLWSYLWGRNKEVD